MNVALTKKQKTMILWASAVFFALVYVSLSFSHNVWTDEAFTIELLKNDFEGIIRGTASDVHPPLYYLIAKCVTVCLGDSLFVLKLVSIFPMFLCMSAGAGIVRNCFGFRAALLFNLLLGAIPCTMEYATQVRMYSWAICFVTFMGLWAYEACREARWRYFAGIVLTSVCAAYTHYFAFVSVIWIYGFLFLFLLLSNRKGLGKWFLSVVCSIILYLPWFPFMELQVKGVSRNYWIEEITGETVKGFLPFLFDMDIPWTTGIWTGFLLAGAGIAIVMAVRREREEDLRGGVFALLLLLTPILTGVTGVVLSSLIRPVFIVRYLLPCMGLTALFLSITLSRYGGQLVYGAMILFFTAAFLVDYKGGVYLEYEWTHVYETEKFLEEHVGENDIIAYNYESYDFVYDCYWSDEEKTLWQDIDLDQAPYDTIWLLDTIYWPSPTDEYLAEKGWKREFMGNYGIEHNDFKIYAITRQ